MPRRVAAVADVILAPLAGCTDRRIQKLMPTLEALDVRKFSMRELLDINDGSFVETQTVAVKELIAHVLACPVRRVRSRPVRSRPGRSRPGPRAALTTSAVRGSQLCREKGSICEVCRNPQPIYPFQTAQVQQCPGACLTRPLLRAPKERLLNEAVRLCVVAHRVQGLFPHGLLCWAVQMPAVPATSSVRSQGQGRVVVARKMCRLDARRAFPMYVLTFFCTG